MFILKQTKKDGLMLR